MSWGSILSTGLNIFGAISSKKAGDKAAALNERLTDAQVAALDQQTKMLGEQYGIEKGVRSNLLNKIYFVELLEKHDLSKHPYHLNFQNFHPVEL